MMGINQLSLHALMMNQAALNSLTAGILPQATAAPTAQQGGDDASGAQQGGDAAAGVQPGADAAASAAANAIPLQAAIPTLTSQQLQQLLASHQLVLPGLQAGIPGISAAASQPLGSALPLSLPISTLGASGGLPVSFPIISTGLPTLGTSVPQDTTAVAASAPTGAEAADPTAASAASAPATLGASTQAQGLPLMIGLGGLPALGAAGTDVTGIPQPMEGMAQLGGGASAAQQLGIGVLGQAAQQGDAAAGQGVTIAGLPALMPQVLGGLPLGTAALSAGDAAAPVAAAPAALPVLDAGAVAAASLPLPASLPEAIATPAPQADSAPAPGPAAESAAPSGAPTAE